MSLTVIALLSATVIICALFCLFKAGNILLSWCGSLSAYAKEAKKQKKEKAQEQPAPVQEPLKDDPWEEFYTPTYLRKGIAPRL